MRSNSHMPAALLRQARHRLLESGELPEHSVDACLRRSWQRSLAAGLSPTGRLVAPDNLSAAQLGRALGRNHELLGHSRPIMEYLFEQVRHSHSMVVLADSRGVLIHTLGDPDFLGKAERVALTAGACWDERRRGTNAIGTALVEAAGVEIHGAEHFLERNTFLTCAAAPIVSATGELLGILDISGDQRSRHPHTLGLVSTAALMIENRLVADACRRYLRLHLHADPAGIGTVAEGIVAVAEDGWIVGANRSALAMLGLVRADIGATPIERVLDLRLDDLRARAGRQPQRSFRVHGRDGAILHASVEGQPSRPLAVVQQGAASAGDALSALDSGDARWRCAADKARRIAGKDIALLLSGESGVGKEVFARAVHDSAPQRDGPFVAINCAALPENLIEAELFGYLPGAFTGARKGGYCGRLREAHGGTLFLDEIGDMPLAMQTRLLRVLQERKVTPLGGGAEVEVTFALICATHRDLPAACAAGQFRSDLYYRINGLTLRLPALRERTDFAALCARLLDELAPAAPPLIAPALLERLAAYDWPGNLRQLASALRTACAMLDAGECRIDWTHLPDDLVDALQAPQRREAPAERPLSLDELSLAAIRRAVDEHAGNLSAAARQLGVSRQTLYRKLARVSRSGTY